MSGKALFIDTTKCTACRGCQIACKQWNRNSAEKTVNRGSHQNPEDLSFSTWKLVRFNETIGPDGKLRWFFFVDQCRHCLEPPCREMVEPDAILLDESTGAVIHTAKLKGVPLEDVRDSCPFDIPRVNADGVYAKCTMCVDRVANGLLPACVKTCPTGSLNFGDREQMVTLAQERLAERLKKNPDANLTGLEDLRVFYLLDAPAENYWRFADTSGDSKLDRMQALKRVVRPLLKSGIMGYSRALFG